MTAPDAPIGWLPEEVRIDEATSSSRLRWVLVLDSALPGGVAVNAAVCLAANVGRTVPGLLGPDGDDADGGTHPGLPWAGCTVLGATAEQLDDLRARATDAEGVSVVDLPESAQTNRVYAEYLAELGRTPAADLQLRAISLLGPRNRINKLTKKLDLLA